MNRQGFSLIEVLVALVIVVIMGAVVSVNLIGASDDAKIASTSVQLDNFRNQLILFKTQQGFLPTQQQGLEALVKEPTIPPFPPRYPESGYLTSNTVPLDGWGNAYIYLIPGRENQPFEVISYGADNLEGGEGADADLSTSD